MTTDIGQYPRVKHALPLQADRRKASVPKGVPLIGGLGLLVVDRRSHRERRKYLRIFNQSRPCALLLWRERNRQPRSFLRKVSLRWHGGGHENPVDSQLPWLLRWRRPSKVSPLTRIGAWFKQRFGSSRPQ